MSSNTQRTRDVTGSSLRSAVDTQQKKKRIDGAWTTKSDVVAGNGGIMGAAPCREQRLRKNAAAAAPAAGEAPRAAGKRRTAAPGRLEPPAAAPLQVARKRVADVRAEESHTVSLTNYGHNGCARPDKENVRPAEKSAFVQNVLQNGFPRKVDRSDLPKPKRHEPLQDRRREVSPAPLARYARRAEPAVNPITGMLTPPPSSTP